MTQDEHLASFGLGSSMMGILLLASGICFVMGLGNVLPQAYGSGNYRLVGTYQNRMIIMTIGIFAPLLIPL